jgi:hypothetical protein
MTLYKSLVAACLLCALWSARQVHALANDCLETPAAAATEGAAAPGRQLLGQGIALFDAKNFKMAERALQSALFAGLPDRQERASAHKYLAFVFCSNSEWARCEAEFDSAFSARAEHALARCLFALAKPLGVTLWPAGAGVFRFGRRGHGGGFWVRAEQLGDRGSHAVASSSVGRHAPIGRPGRRA